jgi:phage terminase large subunit-like protein
MNPNKGMKVSVDEQGKLSKLLNKFKDKESKLTAQPKDLIYVAKLIEHYQHLQETGGHLHKLFVEGPLSIEHYPRHKTFFDCTATYKESLFMAANRVGKSEAGAYTATCWATGLYPDWWQGRVFDKPTNGWVVGDTNETVRSILQEKLLGSPHGTGLLPESCIEDVVIRPNTGGTVDTIYVKHVSGKISRIQFRTYQQGPEAFYGTAKDWIWLDEEPTGKDALMIWNQCYVRTMTTDGSILITFTPLHGVTPMIRMFQDTAEDLTPLDD